jgi:hypothetical protein
MENLEEKVKPSYEKPPHTKTYDRDKFQEIDMHRRKAANSSNALEYKIYCDALGIEPEEQYLDLYTKGIEEYEQKKFTPRVQTIEYHIEKALHGNQKFKPEIKKKVTPLTEYQEEFLKKVEEYKFDMNPFHQIEEKKRLLQKYHITFQKGGRKNLNTNKYNDASDPSKIGRLFRHIVENYKNRKDAYKQYIEF